MFKLVIYSQLLKGKLMKNFKHYTYVMLKPGFTFEEIKKSLKGKLKEAGMDIVQEGELTYSIEDASKHYEEHKGKSFYDSLINYITSGKCYGFVVGSDNPDTIMIVRNLAKGFRVFVPEHFADLLSKHGVKVGMTENVVHSSDCPESAEKESKIFAKNINKHELTK